MQKISLLSLAVVACIITSTKSNCMNQPKYLRPFGGAKRLFHATLSLFRKSDIELADEADDFLHDAKRSYSSLLAILKTAYGARIESENLHDTFYQSTIGYSDEFVDMLYSLAVAGNKATAYKEYVEEIVTNVVPLNGYAMRLEGRLDNLKSMFGQEIENEHQYVRMNRLASDLRKRAFALGNLNQFMLKYQDYIMLLATHGALPEEARKLVLNAKSNHSCLIDIVEKVLGASFNSGNVDDDLDRQAVAVLLDTFRSLAAARNKNVSYQEYVKSIVAHVDIKFLNKYCAQLEEHLRKMESLFTQGVKKHRSYIAVADIASDLRATTFRLCNLNRFMIKYQDYIMLYEAEQRIHGLYGDCLVGSIHTALSRCQKNYDSDLPHVTYHRQMSAHIHELQNFVAQLPQKALAIQASQVATALVNNLSKRTEEIMLLPQYAIEIHTEAEKARAEAEKQKLSIEIERATAEKAAKGVLIFLERERVRAEQARAIAEENHASAAHRAADATEDVVYYQRKAVSDARWRNGEYVSWFLT